MANYVSEQDLNQIKGLLHYLNQNLQPIDGLGADVTLIDANGEPAAIITWEQEPGAGYVVRIP